MNNKEGLINKKSERMVKVIFNNYEVREFKEGTSLKEISEFVKDNFLYDILVAKVDNDICDLSETINKKCSVEFFDRSSQLGNTVYFSSAIFMLILAARNILGEDAHITTEHSLDRGVFCLVDNAVIDKKIIKKIEDEMHRISNENYLFVKMSVSRTDAMRYFKKRKQMDKFNVLKYISNTYINLYRINDLYDYFHSKMAYSTGQINDFKLTYVGDNGFVLSAPDIINPECTLDYTHHELVYQEFKHYNEFGHNIGIVYASDLNRAVSMAKVDELIRISEAYYDNQLSVIANEICATPGKYKLVLLTGPSSSGKSTTANKLKTYIRSHGVNIYSMSTDDYFKTKEHIPKDELLREYDFDSIDALDVELFNKHLISLFNGERVEIPKYNFIKGKREYVNNFIKLKENDIIIVEGIQALNEKLTMSVDQKNIYKIFLSPLTHLNIDSHNHIHTSDIRKLRRIVRDNKSRGHNAAETLSMWHKIYLNEKSDIYPHQDEVNKVINSSLVYEIGVLKTYVEPLLFNIPEDDPVYPEALRLINFLRNFLPIPSDDIPNDSVLREFIGGSCFKD